ncbi:unnamed protein product [Soboliphyme baturini]|uniref:Ig-like domain-containing protein n=1 Tax=Soboliphyme baturini TaxID=241478 RepID=A0A183IPE7_9BILA|nr:unnamed protein product [Soboliphyme baturini]
MPGGERDQLPLGYPDKASLRKNIAGQTVTMKAAPIYEIHLDTGLSERTTETAEVGIGEAFHLRCSIQGHVHKDNKIIWLLEGQELQSSHNCRIHTRKNKRVSTLKIAKCSAEHIGTYECGTRSTRGILITKKFVVKMRPKSYNASLYGEVLCSDAKKAYCLNEGICLYHVASDTYACRCMPEYIGMRCEYLATSVIASVQSSDVRLAEMQKVFIGLLSVMAIALMTLLVLFIYCLRRKRNAKSFVLESGWLSRRSHKKHDNFVTDEGSTSSISKHVSCSKCGREFRSDCQVPDAAVRYFQPVRLAEASTQWSPPRHAENSTESMKPLVLSPRASNLISGYSDGSTIDVKELEAMIERSSSARVKQTEYLPQP